MSLTKQEMKEQLLESFEENRKDQVQSKIREARKWIRSKGLWDNYEFPDLPHIPDEIKVSRIFRDTIKLIYPRDPDIMKEVQEALEAQGLKESWRRADPEDAEWIIQFTQYEDVPDRIIDEVGYVDFNLVYDIEHPDSTCVRTKIGEGEETKRVEYWEVTCKDGAKEDVFMTKTTKEKVDA